MNVKEKGNWSRLLVAGAVGTASLLNFCGAEASIIVTNDWAEAVVQVREGKHGGSVVSRQNAEGMAEFDINAFSSAGGSRAGIMSGPYQFSSDSFINAFVLTDDSRDEAEAWLQMSWSFTVQDDPVDFLIDLRVESGGDFTSTYQLYDQTTGSMILDEALYGYGGVSAGGTLSVGHEYIFNAFLPRIDGYDNQDQVWDGATLLDFHGIDTTVTYLNSRTHDPRNIPEPSSFATLVIGLASLVFFRRLFFINQ